MVQLEYVYCKCSPVKKIFDLHILKKYANCFYTSWFFSSTRMCHATKKIKCDTHNDEYFEGHYQLSQGLVNSDEEYDEYYCQTLLFSKCQKDPLNTVSSVIVDY